MKSEMASCQANSNQERSGRRSHSGRAAPGTRRKLERQPDYFREDLTRILIVPDLSSALDLMVRALDKVRVGSHRELKRLYWRDKHRKRPIRQIVQSDATCRSGLIMFESEGDEKILERACNVTAQAGYD